MLPLTHAISIACLIARSTLEAVVLNLIAIVGYNPLVIEFKISISL